MNHPKILLKLIGLLLVFYLALRLIFISMYAPGGLHEIVADPRILYWGLRLDLTAVICINLPFIFFFLIIAPHITSGISRRISSWLFIVVNLVFLAINTIDLVYFRFNARRSTIDLPFALAESVGSFPGLFNKYWPVLLLFIIVAMLFIRFTRIILRDVLPLRDRKVAYLLMASCLLGVAIIIARGVDSRPVGPSTPLLYFHPSLQPAVNNSTLNFLYSAIRFKTSLERKAFYSTTALDSIFPIKKIYGNHRPMTRKNVVVLMLESMNEDFFVSGPSRAYTPFLDSIRRMSTLCTNAYQNGHESVKGALATLTSIPPFTEEPMFISNYNAIPFDGIGTLLTGKGYKTSFFLGAEYDHFNFAKLCRMAGITDYYSKDDMGGAYEEDGHWGLYDEYVFDFFRRKTDEIPEPFFSVLYNISTHPPFSIPRSRQQEFAITGQDAQQNSVSYIDACLRKLFADAGKSQWFSNTIFVFIADHSLPPYTEARSAIYTTLRIPFFIFDPANPVSRVITKPVQQMDVVPTILDLLDYPDPFLSFGNSIYGSASGYSVSKTNGALQIIDSMYLTGMDEQASRLLYHYNLRSDAGLNTNKVGKDTSTAIPHVRLLRGLLQRFNNSLLDNNLRVN